MKILSKLSISPEKIMKNEELINLQGGGYGSKTCVCWKWGSDETKTVNCECSDPVEDVCGVGWDGHNCT